MVLATALSFSARQHCEIWWERWIPVSVQKLKRFSSENSFSDCLFQAVPRMFFSCSDVVVDLIYLVDLLLNFRMGFLEEGILVQEPKLILQLIARWKKKSWFYWKYLRTWLSWQAEVVLCNANLCIFTSWQSYWNSCVQHHVQFVVDFSAVLFLFVTTNPALWLQVEDPIKLADHYMLRRKSCFTKDIIAALPFSSIALLFTGKNEFQTSESPNSTNRILPQLRGLCHSSEINAIHMTSTWSITVFLRCLQDGTGWAETKCSVLSNQTEEFSWGRIWFWSEVECKLAIISHSTVCDWNPIFGFSKINPFEPRMASLLVSCVFFVESILSSKHDNTPFCRRTKFCRLKFWQFCADK